MNEVGVIFIGMVGIGAVIIILLIMKVVSKHMEKVKTIVAGILKNLMWSSVIRCIL